MSKNVILKKYWGVNKKKLSLILGFLGVCYLDKKNLPKNLSKKVDLILTNLINLVSVKHKKKLKDKIKLFVSLRLAKGLQHISGYPVNGQTMKRNNKTQKRLYKSRIS